MSMRSLETVILHHSRRVFCNSKLRLKDILEWNTGKINPREGEVTAHVSDPGVFVTIAVVHDRRKPELIKLEN